MDTQQIVAALIAERDRLTRAIEALQGPVRRRGRPPKNPFAVMTNGATPEANAKRGRRTFTTAQRKAQAQRMKKYWAAKKKAAK
jgi:hypothetical protein